MLAHDPRFEMNAYHTRLNDQWKLFLTGCRDLFKDVDQPRCFISYAWPPAGPARDRLQQRLKHMKLDLETIGATVYLDITNLASNINGFMDKLDSCNHVLFIGTPRLRARLMEAGDNNAKYEYRRIQQRVATNPDFMLPLVFEGDHSSAFPNDLGNILSRDFSLSYQGWSNGGDIYLHNMIDISPLGLIPVLYNLTLSSAKAAAYVKIRDEFVSQMMRIKQEHQDDCNGLYQRANDIAGRGDFAAAYPLYQQAANRLHSPSCYRVSFFYDAEDREVGGAHRPVPKNNELALQWLQRGAEFGHVKSMIQLAERLATRGRDYAQSEDLELALQFAQKAKRSAEARDQNQADATLARVQRLRSEYLAKVKQDPAAMLELSEHLLRSTGGIKPPTNDRAKEIQFGEALRLAQAARSRGMQTADLLIHEIQVSLKAITLLGEGGLKY